MKILLIGEYSGVHTNLKKILLNNGHSVYLIHDGDSYKKFDSNDFSIKYNRIISKNKIINTFFSIFYLILDLIGLKGLLQSLKYLGEIRELKDFDIVQIINTKPFSQFGTWANYLLLKQVFKNNKKVYLCVLGDDFTWVKSCLEKKPPYSMFDNFKLKNIKDFIYSLTYVYGFGAKLIDQYVLKNVEEVIPGLYDYYFAYNAMGRNCSEVIPIAYEGTYKKNKEIKYPIRIFHGWQIGKELRKGNVIFDNAIKKLIKKYPDFIEYNVVQNVVYDEYIKLFDNSDIVVDQCYSLDKGVNALIGMSNGKVVFSGCDKLTKEYYSNGIENCLINAEPNEDKIFQQLEALILNKERIIQIQENARAYMENYHSYNYVYRQYCKIWKIPQ
ncbi:MAG: glycosyltransferase family 1 protein [Bacilli bacterium]